jgi:type II secretion system protein E
MVRSERALIGEILVEAGVITQEQLAIGLEEQEKKGGFICTTLIRLGFASEEKILSVLSYQLKIPYVKLKDRSIEPSIIAKVAPKFATYYQVIPVEVKAKTLLVAMVNPIDVFTLQTLRLLLGVEVKGILASEQDIREAMRRYYGVGAETLEKMADQEDGETQLAEQEKVQDLEAMAGEASVIRFVNQILSEALRQRATDVHLEPFQDELRVRFRVDGILYPIHVAETIKYFHAAIVSRVKIMSQLNIAERRLPQDGRIKIKQENQELDLRVSTVPTEFGEAVHIRILNTQFFLDLGKLGLAAPDLELLGGFLKKPHGIIFVTGPTGSGKTTTLYACLARLNSTERKIITIEDPIEYQLRGVIQMQVNPRIQFDFSAGLRHILRHDPDVIMVGEVRDQETAETAIRSALTGHLVFSTLHTNDAAGAVTRLLDMGIEPFLLASSLECVIAQRLVRLLCPRCKVPTPLRPEFAREIAQAGLGSSGQTVFEPKGCPECRMTGYYGRTGVHEILTITQTIRDLVLARASSQQIKQKALTEGMRTLRQDGLNKVLRGLTSFAEVIRVTQQEEIS